MKFRHGVAALGLLFALVLPVSSSSAADTSGTAGGPIKVLLFAGPIANITKAHLSEFESSTGIKVDLTIVGGEVINTKTSTELLGSGTSYDVISIRGDSMPFYGTKNVLLDMSAMLADPKATPADYKVSDIGPLVMDFYKWNNQQIGVPWQVASYVLYYRKDLLKAAGLQNPPKTAQEYADYAKKLNQPPVYGTGLTMQKSHNLTSEYFQWLTTFGGDVVDANGHVVLDSPQARDALKYYVALRAYAPPDVTNWAYERLTTGLAQGQVAMSIQWTDTAAVMVAPGSKVADTMSFTTPPVKEKPTAVIGGWGLSIPANTTHKESAFKFIQWATGPGMAQQLATLGGTPARLSILRNATLNKKYPWFTAQADALEMAKPRPRTPAWPAIDDAMSSILSQVVTGAMSVDDGVTKMANEAKKRVAEQ
jgi:multiple sugar transport system substrate-binding protein